MATLTLAQHTSRLITCLAEAVDYAQTTSPGTGHNAGMWQAAITEARGALAAEATQPQVLADLVAALTTIDRRHSFCFSPNSRDVATAQEAAQALRQAQAAPSATAPIQQPPAPTALASAAQNALALLEELYPTLSANDTTLDMAIWVACEKLRYALRPASDAPPAEAEEEAADAA